MNKRMKKKRWLGIKLAECLAREHLLMSEVIEQNTKIAKQTKEIAWAFRSKLRLSTLNIK